ncbi:AKT-interacting protein-like [Daphnia carinata]|uniref:AKT-interacting protein-like n=1 Tax=Daphnia carinata TaxID=120202 RepID=UPI00257E79CD|nr:AKT-interacting protein-like [Daphnia carinata]XP_057364537.1 AKT-interacting protein-like [Daphnia carinata]
MEFRNIASTEAHFLDKDTQEVMSKYQPVFMEYSILAEYNALRDQSKILQDVYVMPSSKDPLHWFGLIFLRSGCYAGAVFRFNIFIGKNFPQTDIPNIVFAPPIFHPKVDPVSGYMETRSSFGKWQVGVHHVWHLLLYIKKSLLVIDNRDSVNQVAADLFTHDRSEFQARATECIMECKERLNDSNQYSSDPHYLRFSPYNPNIHGTFRKAVLANAKSSGSTTAGKSLSWVKPGSLQPCSSQD